MFVFRGQMLIVSDHPCLSFPEKPWSLRKLKEQEYVYFDVTSTVSIGLKHLTLMTSSLHVI